MALFLLSPWFCHPFIFPVFFGSGVKNALKSSFVTLPGTPRIRQDFLCFTLLVLVIQLLTGDRGSSFYSVSRKKIFLHQPHWLVHLSYHASVSLWIFKQLVTRLWSVRIDLCSFEIFILIGSQVRLHYLNVLSVKLGRGIQWNKENIPSSSHAQLGVESTTAFISFQSNATSLDQNRNMNLLLIIPVSFECCVYCCTQKVAYTWDVLLF